MLCFIGYPLWPRYPAQRTTAAADDTFFRPSLGEILYDPVVQLGNSLDAGIEVLRNEGWSEAQIADERKEMAALTRELRLPGREIPRFHSLLTHYRVNPADEETHKGWVRDSRRQLRNRYPEDWERRVEAVRTYVRANKKLATWLTDSGLASHPEVVMHFAERAYELGKPR